MIKLFNLRFCDSTNTDFKTNIYRSFEKEQKHVILKLLPFQQNGNELTVPNNRSYLYWSLSSLKSSLLPK